MTSKVEHGTDSGYTYHYTVWKTPACAACKAVHKKVNEQTYAARGAAISRLLRLYPTVWRALFDEEKAKRGL